jgi:phage terminase large subunit
VAHRRAGKTVATIADLIDGVLRCPLENARGAYVAPTYVQAKDVAWGYAKQYSARIPGVTFNESELRIDYPGGARIRLYGAENYDRMRGLYLDRLVLDEYADMNPAAWPEVLRPALSDRKGSAVFIGTPKGRNAFWEVCEHAKESGEWFYDRMRASETGIVDPGELADARASMTTEQYATEFECSFDSAVVGAYYGAEIEAAYEERRIASVPHDPALPVTTYWDLGLDDATAVLFVQLHGKEIRIIEAEEWTQTPLTQVAKEVMDRPYTYADHVLPHDVRVREMTTGRSREEVLRNILGRLSVAPQLSVEDGINALRTIFSRIWLDEKKSAKFVEAAKNYRKKWDDKRKVFENRPYHDWSSHLADAGRMLAVSYREKIDRGERDRYARRAGRRSSAWAA